MGNSDRYRSWNLVLYVDSKELARMLLKSSKAISQYAYCRHNKDVYEENVLDGDGSVLHAKGDLKKEHYHLIVDFYHGHTFTAVKKLFSNLEDAARVERVGSRKECFEYLVHRNHPDKYQYRYQDIVSSDITYWEKFCKEGDKRDNDNLAESIVNEILRGVSPRLLVARYGRDFVIHMKQYYDCAHAILNWDIDHPVLNKKDLVVDDEQIEIPFD